ncbi:hypothetical protein EN978_25725 [Mesorhizobium sp. M7A.F.Ca.US.001.04.1.1]|uniref:hypothetical protein n=1 Tax=Mesorhizobium sp. M7A.F.Ca.US.001.04.1.1 TaxID=2496726 RepID=UPI000FCC3B75|nr:hypothetical protein [Mesorhizobium sp. M7A.F.Ca.US.001.04.1.1]RUY37844.1 hypothetical protein EN978_25725 [Mesorhizobium sp. M7A.F.Ca.US.001.04.1.1]
MTHSDPSRTVRLYGTEEPPAEERVLNAGPLSVLFDGANLRDVRMHGEEAIRAISFVVRDKDWATLIPKIADLIVQQDGDRFWISYRAGVAGNGETFGYEVVIEGSAAGVLTYSARGKTPTGLLTNRTGFVVLHPIEGVSGAPATITHTSGERVETRFPVEIDPVQPMMDLREIAHRTPGGLEVTCLMEGDAFEMEDQRNWTDASYKTYVRPLALPWPYRIEPGEVVQQKITLTVKGFPRAPSRWAGGAAVLTLGEAEGTMPPLGIGLQPEDASAALRHVETLHQLGVAHIICHHDPRRGHDAESLARHVEVAAALGAQPWLEAVVEHVNDAGAAAEIDFLGKLVAKLDRRFATVLVSPAPDLKCTLPGSVWPAAPAPAKLYAATRTAFPGSRIGGGMFSFFTELNRKRPPTETIDLVTFTTAAIFHAGDDRSLMETLECLPHIVRTVPAIARGLPYSVGPSAIGLRDNPYGEAPVANPTNIRQAVNFNDPRQRGVMGAAWNSAISLPSRKAARRPSRSAARSARSAFSPCRRRFRSPGSRARANCILFGTSCEAWRNSKAVRSVRCDRPSPGRCEGSRRLRKKAPSYGSAIPRPTRWKSASPKASRPLQFLMPHLSLRHPVNRICSTA